MSLINDALKRARQTQQKNPPGGPALFPAEIRTTGGIGWFLLVLIIALVFAAGLFIALALFRRVPAQPPVTVALENVATQHVASASVAVPATPSRPPAPVSTPVPLATNEMSVSNAAPAPPPPQTQLQGIIYDPVNPWAIVNGKTVYVGDHLGDFRVKEITKDSVTLQNVDGSLKTLVIGQ